MEIRSIGIDRGRTDFHLVALDQRDAVLVRRKFTQKQLLTHAANLQTCLIGLKACSGAHFLGRALREQGHDVRLIAAQFVKPFVKSNKNDFVDAEAIAEAVGSRRLWTRLTWFRLDESENREKKKDGLAHCTSPSCRRLIRDWRRRLWITEAAR